MTIKQFLKPDWRKIVVTVIFLIYSVIINIYFYSVDLTSTASIMLLLAYFLNLPYTILFSQELIPYQFEFICFIIIGFIYQYLLSCLIIWIYDKFRKKKK